MNSSIKKVKYNKEANKDPLCYGFEFKLLLNCKNRCLFHGTFLKLLSRIFK